MAKKIPLTQGKFTLVDDDMFDYLNQWKWHLCSSGYARRQIRENGKVKHLHMHALIMGTPKGMVTDHINHDRLDNRKENLRVCTYSQNLMNYGMKRNNTSGYRGVSGFKNKNKWQAEITINRKKIYLGTYQCKHEAARAYNKAALELHGEFAYQNEIFG